MMIIPNILHPFYLIGSITIDTKKQRSLSESRDRNLGFSICGSLVLISDRSFAGTAGTARSFSIPTTFYRGGRKNEMSSL